jgi:RNA polymerase sigma-70 factor (ECF subfamily)
MMEPEVLGQLFDQHAPALVLYARQWCVAPEDVVQEAFIKLATLQPPPERPAPWLYRVVRNAALNAACAARRRRRHEAAAAEARPWFAVPDSPTLDVEAATAALQELPLEQREVIIARLWGGLTFEQTGELMGTSASTAYRGYVAGLSALRDRLGVLCPNRSKTRL